MLTCYHITDNVTCYLLLFTPQRAPLYPPAPSPSLLRPTDPDKFGTGYFDRPSFREAGTWAVKSQLGKAMDDARGYFGPPNVLPAEYTATAWYQFTNASLCVKDAPNLQLYECLIVRYFFWAVSSRNGGENQRAASNW